MTSWHSSGRRAAAAVDLPTPNKRRLRVYAFDPGAAVELDTAIVNDAVIALGWEKPWQEPLRPGPINEYLEVVDYDFPAGMFYEPVDLDAPHLLAQDGLPPSEGRPQFHQQMVFAVAMKTIETFERALGRPVFWAHPKLPKNPDGSRAWYPDFIKRLRIYPHAMRKANAYYSPAKGALLFGYFKSEPQGIETEGSWIFTCLSADIVAHEATHAILHGLRRRSVEPTNADSFALHEAFADIVALLQHFTMNKVVESELARTGGVLRSLSLLTGLASQFGRAVGRNGALRMALEILAAEQGEVDRADHRARLGIARETQFRRLADVEEPHDRGSILVAAVFDAFVRIYERRTADLFRLAGVTPGARDALPALLIGRLAEEACRCANSVLEMCVRGLDYLPPVSPTFGEYLRAIITADADLYPEDPYKYRVALAEAFRKRGIPVPGCLSFAPDSLLWEPPDLSPFTAIGPDIDPHKLFADALGQMIYAPRYPGSPERTHSPGLAEKTARDIAGAQERAAARAQFLNYSTYRDVEIAEANLRDESMRVVMFNQQALHGWLEQPERGPNGPDIDRAWETLLGLRLARLEPDADLAINHDADRNPIFDVHTVRIARRRAADGRELHQLIASVTQKKHAFFDLEEQDRCREHGPRPPVEGGGTKENADPDFWFRGGATVIVNLQDGRVTHVIRKRIDKDERLAQQRRYLLGDDDALAMAVAGGQDQRTLEPFAFMHGSAG